MDEPIPYGAIHDAYISGYIEGETFGYIIGTYLAREAIQPLLDKARQERECTNRPPSTPESSPSPGIR